jgi:thioredoxin-dependent peroxiredoxin
MPNGRRREDMRILSVLMTLWTAFSTIACAQDLKVGDKAPDFALPGSDGKTYRLADYLGKKPVVLAWFPKAFTSG